MNKDFRTFLLRMALGIPAIIAGVVFRPFWLSDWGMPTFIFLAWVATSIAIIWAGKGTRHSFLIGIIVGSSFALALVAVALTHSVLVGIGLLLALLYVEAKTRFFARWGEQENSHPKE
ncbi:hypothetical protein OOJ09_09495 [Mesorhizobium qingshengii]|uniref:SPW repeat-containing protein n=1 Tax=Mesorhizobium qingshengii TaxID=1165689 RepID=A0ABT4QS51_9HYPH|nr:hypothetical protein [Mesorhizobium qingshengii]MCZ8544412.1 hypothetical protein [Mesorhizobium qingshengii]